MKELFRLVEKITLEHVFAAIIIMFTILFLTISCLVNKQDKKSQDKNIETKLKFKKYHLLEDRLSSSIRSLM